MRALASSIHEVDMLCHAPSLTRVGYVLNLPGGTQSMHEHSIIHALGCEVDRWPLRRWQRAAVLLTGVVVGQFILYGPSLLGYRVLLPLDLLQMENAYLPAGTAETFVPQHRAFTDEIMVHEPWRRFAVSEVRQGRLPLWNPHNYCGAPFLAANQSALFSPFRVLDYLFPGTLVIAWSQLLKSAVAAVGMYLFLRRAVRVNFWPATIAAWCFPISGFMILWRGYPLSAVVAWFSWILLAVDRAIERPAGWGGIGLALATAAALLTGHSAMAAQVLLIVGGYALWKSVVGLIAGKRRWNQTLAAAIVVAAGFGFGGLLSAPQSLPTAEYLNLSYRVAMRRSGYVETPPRGLAALPQLVLPTIYGSERRGSTYLAPGFSLESAAGGYAGLIMALFAAPLGWYSVGHRSQMAFWSLAAVFGAAQVLDLPGFATVFRTFPFDTLRNNRFVFVTGFAVLTMAAIGLDALHKRITHWQWWWSWLPIALTVALVVWCAWCAVDPPGVVTQLGDSGGRALFVRTYLVGAILAGLVALWWLSLARGSLTENWEWALVAALAVGAPLVRAYGVNPQCDPSLDFPRLSILERLRTAPAGRTCGALCLPVSLNLVYGLDEIRGYDGADPAQYVDLMCAYRALHPQFRSPVGDVALLQPHPSPVLDMLNLRYEIHRGTPTAGTKAYLADDDHYVIERIDCLPRAFVPQRVEVISDDDERLRRLAAPDFAPRRLAFVEQPLDLPSACQGEASIFAESPNELTLRFAMRTAGCLVLADTWYPGWRAYLGDREVPMLRVNHALRGVVLPAGVGQLQMRFEPASFYLGLQLALFAVVALVLWAGGIALANLRRKSTPVD
ncbi:MAG: hypothetical protein AB7U73_15430 [Pirellulales bacterium]